MNVPEKLEVPVVVKDTDGNEHEVERFVYRLERNGKSRWVELFGTPERAARTMEEFELDQINWCHGTDGCEKCPYEFDRYGCCLPDGFSLLEWLRGEI